MAKRQNPQPWLAALGVIAMLFGVTVVGFSGCSEKAMDDFMAGVKTSGEKSGPNGGKGAVRNTSTEPPVRSTDTVRIASFNIQVFGQSKLEKRGVMAVLADVVKQFDIVAIQELRSKSQDVIPRFLELINAKGAHYRSVVGPRLGRTSSKEQYVYLYDASRLVLTPGSAESIHDPQDVLHRPPLFANFRVRGTSSQDAFSFTLINVHTDPDETDVELDALDDVFQYVQARHAGEDDIILLGDLNVDHRKLGQLGQLPFMTCVIRGEATNTRQNRSYDNILFNTRTTVEFTGRGGVMNLISVYGLTPEQALEVSDHFPVWAEFSATENARPRVAARPE